MKHQGRTAPFRLPNGTVIPDSIAETKYLRLGGIDQWVMIRGERSTNPPLILLHGGPGMTEMRMFRHFNAPLEKSFTVVNWDQRGTGKSFSRNIPKSAMTVEQFIRDLDELVNVVRERLGQDQVVLYGHSWGSVIGVLYAARYPQKVAAYVASGQIADAQAGERASYAYALREAERTNNEKALRELRAIGEPPHTADELWVERMWLARFEGMASARSTWKVMRIILGGPESSWLDAANAWRGWKFSLDAMWREVSTLNLMTAVPALEMPVFFFLGRKDHWVPPETSAAYFTALRAPLKKLVWFENSGHLPFMDEAEKFNRAMVELVRPVVVPAEAHEPGELVLTAR